MKKIWLSAIPVCLVSVAAMAQPPGERPAHFGPPAPHAPPAHLQVCAKPHARPLGGALQSCEDPAKECARFDTNRPETLRSNLCDAKLANASIGADFSLFGRNDCRVLEQSRSLDSIHRVVIHNGGYSARMNSDT